MVKEFQQLLKTIEKGERSPFALSDFDVLGEDLFLIKTIGDQLMLYTDVINECGAGRKDIYIHISLDTLWGMGQMLKRLTEQIDEKIDVLDHKFDLLMCDDEPEKKES
ncbi:MAG: hypothetical protein OEV42_12520 [Deltaproteobacteria bacterium]|nr:hypothetical protein [Deltaproteobacteria bacterium]